MAAGTFEGERDARQPTADREQGHGQQIAGQTSHLISLSYPFATWREGNHARAPRLPVEPPFRPQLRRAGNNISTTVALNYARSVARPYRVCRANSMATASQWGGTLNVVRHRAPARRRAIAGPARSPRISPRAVQKITVDEGAGLAEAPGFDTFDQGRRKIGRAIP